MLRRTYDNQVCSLAWALEVVGERWTLLIVRDALHGISRFGDFQRRLGITASVLSARLDFLVGANILHRVPYQTGPVRYEYRLTASGRDLGYVVLALMRWGDRHLTGDAPPPRVAYHRECGDPVELELTCTRCACQLSPEQVTTRPGTRDRAARPVG